MNLLEMLALLVVSGLHPERLLYGYTDRMYITHLFPRLTRKKDLGPRLSLCVLLGVHDCS